MELLNGLDDFEQNIEKMRVENFGLEYEEENDDQSLDQESEYEEEQPFNPEKIRVDQQMLSVKYMLELMEEGLIELNPEYYIGIDMIDQEHKQLFDYASEAYELLQEEFTPDKYDHIDAILQKLRDYTAKHFADEEAYMESIQYKKIFTQKIQHQEFIKKLDEFIDQHEKDEENQDEQIMDILNYLTDWLINHILHVDGQIPKEA